VIPEILDDGRRLLQPWQKAGTLDPFDRIYEASQLLSSPSAVRPEIVSVRKWAAIMAHVDCIERVLTPLLIPAHISGYRAVSDVHGNS
jgi:hypothetical protein